MRSVRVLFCFVFLVFGFLFFTKEAYAQIPVYSNNTSPNSFASPKMDPDVPRNQHTFTQAVTIEVLASFMCQLVGIDPIDPSTPCLGINPQTRQLGYAPNNLQVGGLIGVTTDLIASTYRPIVSTGVYTEYLSDNFGIVKKVHAQTTSYGFEGLKPVFELWKAVRNVSYGLLVLAFVFIGIGIMFRIKIDPRTVMSIQNQIPKVIICIILITFSYAISALMVDLMWVGTYAGVNLISTSSPKAVALNVGGEPLSKKATEQLLEIPIVYVNGIFHTTNPGIFHLTDKISESIGSIIRDALASIFNKEKTGKCFETHLSFTNPVDFSPQSCVVNLLSGFATFIAELVIFVILIVALFRIWFTLLKAFVYSLVYIIVAPIFIVFGLLPSKPLGFEKWLRSLFANLAVFPLTAFLIVGARLMMDIYDDKTAAQFIPPLIGHNAGGNFGAFVAFGVLLIAPSLQKILQDKLGVKGVGTPGLVAAGAAAGAAVVGAPVGRAMKHLNRTNAQGQAIGALARFKKESGNVALGKLVGAGIPFTEKALEKRLHMQTDPYHSLHGYKAGSEEARARTEKYIGRQRRWLRRRNNSSTPSTTEGSTEEGGSTGTT